MTYYKLTDESDSTYRGLPLVESGYQWGEGVTNETDFWFYVYSDPLLAVFLGPLHSGFGLEWPHLWECKCEGEHISDRGLRDGFKRVTTVRRVELPRVEVEHRVRFAIYCAQAVIGDVCPEWSAWADDWLSGSNRTSPSTTLTAWPADGTRYESRAREAVVLAARAAENAGLFLLTAVEAVSEAAEAEGKLPLIELARKAQKSK